MSAVIWVAYAQWYWHEYTPTQFYIKNHPKTFIWWLHLKRFSNWSNSFWVVNIKKKNYCKTEWRTISILFRGYYASQDRCKGGENEGRGLGPRYFYFEPRWVPYHIFCEIINRGPLFKIVFSFSRTSNNNQRTTNDFYYWLITCSWYLYAVLM